MGFEAYREVSMYILGCSELESSPNSENLLHVSREVSKVPKTYSLVVESKSSSLKNSLPIVGIDLCMVLPQTK